MEVGDIVSIRASRCETSWFINNSVGLLVLHPDMLISSTAVVGSLFCLRRGVLSEWFRGIDCDSRIMIIGSLVHELLQEVIYIFVFNFILCCIFRLSALELCNNCTLNSYYLQFYCISASFRQVDMSVVH